MSNSKYISCIKVAGCPLLPPLIDEDRRAELLKDKEAAVSLEHELTIRRESEFEKFSESTEDQINQSLELDSCSEGTVRLIEYIKNALKNVSHEKQVQNLQNQIFEELKKCESLKTGPGLREVASSSSCDTLKILDASTISTDTDVPGSVTKSDVSDGLSSPENRSGETVVLTESGHTPIRRKSFTLEAPSPAVIRFLQSLGKEDSESDPSVLNQKNSLKNLNDLWVNDTTFLNFSYSCLPSADATSNQSKTENHLSNSELSKSDLDKSSNINSSTSFKELEAIQKSSNNKMPLVRSYSAAEQKSAAVIQAAARGFLTRRLLRTNKVIDLKKTIRDSLVCALKLHSEQTITSADVTLHVRLIRQVTAACYELHSIFFEWTVKEQMTLIRQDRIMALKALSKKRQSVSDKSESRSSPISREISVGLGEDVKNGVSSPSEQSLGYQAWS